jgi:hypothetical protein
VYGASEEKTMSKRISLGRIVAVAVIAALAAIGTVQPVSAEPFLAGGPIEDIDKGDVKAAGKSSRFVVRNRNVSGTIHGTVGDTSFAGVHFTFMFKTNVPIQTQAGNIQGSLSFGSYEAKIIAKSELGVTPVPCPEGWEPWCVETEPGSYFLPGLLINGSVRFTEGAEGNGTVNAFVVPELSPDGHIIGVIAGGLTIQGE